jgi:uncharacterized small protein (DUF1192 family)
MNEPPADLYQRLRRETAALLNFDLSNLTAPQGARLDRAVMLRWELDRCAGSQVRGDAIDVPKMVAASEALERLLSPSFTAEAHESHSARNRLLQLINNIAEITTADRVDEIAVLEAEVARLKATIAEKDSALRAVLGEIPAAATTDKQNHTPAKAHADAQARKSQVARPAPQISSQPPRGYLQTDTPLHLKKPR